jgi:hypothetical protein
MCINAMSRTPANPPPTNAAKTHHNETIVAPVSPGLVDCQGFNPAPWLRRSLDYPWLPIVAFDTDQTRKKSGIEPDGRTCFGTPPER